MKRKEKEALSKLPFPQRLLMHECFGDERAECVCPPELTDSSE